MLIISISGRGQAANQNYTTAYKALVPLTDDLSNKNDKDKVAEVFEYYDGLGRAIQTIMRQASPLGFSVISFFEYDAYGRKSRNYLPYTSSSNTDGSINTSPVTDQAAFYSGLVGSADGANAFSLPVFENSELNRILKQGSAGAAWQPSIDNNSMADHAVKKRSRPNDATEVLLFHYDQATGLVSVKAGSVFQYYGPYQLMASVTYDEHNNDMIEYTDKAGLTICKKVRVSPTDYANTYYVYDDLGKLVVVIPPEGVKALLSN